MKRSHQVSGVLTLLLGLGLSAQAAAADGKYALKDGRFIIAVDRLAGLYGVDTTVDDTTNGETLVSIGGVNSSGGAGLSTLPRVAFDAEVYKGLTVGGGLGLTAYNANDTDVVAWAFMPRVGYLHSFNDWFALWPRLGLGVLGQSSSTDVGGVPTSSSITAWQVNLEVMAVFRPLPFMVINVGPSFDFGIGGSYNTRTEVGNTVTTTSLGAKQSAYGVSAGLGILF